MGDALDDGEVGQMKKKKSKSDGNPGRDYWSCTKCDKKFAGFCDEMPDYDEERPPVCPCVNKPVGCTCKSVIARFTHGMSARQKRREARRIKCSYCRSPESRMDEEEKGENQRDTTPG